MLPFMLYDVMVIGAGLAGLMAALVAQSKGARVLLVSKAMGSLPLTSGCIDLLGYLPGRRESFIDSPYPILAQIGSFWPSHPYSKIGPEKIRQALQFFKDTCSQIGLPYVGDPDRNLLIPTSIGTFHPTCLTPASMKNGDLLRPGPVLLVGIEGIKDFSPLWAAENLNVFHSQSKIASCPFRAQMLERLEIQGPAFNALNLSLALDAPSFRERFVRILHPLLRRGERVGFPATLGFHASMEAWEDLQEKLGVEIFEIPLPPPSIPGLRLYHSLSSLFRQRGGRLFMGLSALQPRIRGDKIEAMALGPSAGSPIYRASAFILATGNFVSGGLNSDRKAIFETLLGLPVKYPSSRSEWSSSKLLNPEGQSFNSIGIEVDEKLRPVNESGNIVFENLFAAGAIIAFANSMAEKSGGGVAISTGYRAGELAADLAKLAKKA
jgi:glycerol-3-phosphate dehydrogenase subunit B